MLRTRKLPGFTPFRKQSFLTGFTLIELLIIVSIIGILAGVILTSVNSSRKKAKNALVKSSIIQATVSIEKYFESSNFNGDLTCLYYYPPATTVTPLLTAGCGGTRYPGGGWLLPPKNTFSPERKEINDIAIYIESLINYSGQELYIKSDTAGYQVFSRLPSTASSAKWFCADSTGKTGKTVCENGGDTSPCHSATDGWDHTNCPSDTQ